MKLYIVRHAIAVDRGTPGIKDEDRALTEEGREKMKRASAGLRSLGYIPGLLLTSPLLRARQTADILLEELGKGIDFETTPALSPSATRQELYRVIGLHSKRNSLMLVGHQPSLGEIAGEIVFGSSEHFIDLKKGGVCAIELESVRGTPKGSMVALLTPSILRKVGV